MAKISWRCSFAIPQCTWGKCGQSTGKQQSVFVILTNKTDYHKNLAVCCYICRAIGNSITRSWPVLAAMMLTRHSASCSVHCLLFCQIKWHHVYKLSVYACRQSPIWIFLQTGHLFLLPFVFLMLRTAGQSAGLLNNTSGGILSNSLDRPWGKAFDQLSFYGCVG